MIDPVSQYNAEFQRKAVDAAKREEEICRRSVRYTRHMRKAVTLADIQEAIEAADANLKNEIVKGARDYDEEAMGLAISAAIHEYLSKLADQRAEKEVG